MELSMWGIAAAGSTVNAVPGRFDIVSEQGDILWTWSLMKNRITTVDLNPAYTDWNEHLDIGFPNDTAAVTWFKWLQEYATTKAVGAITRPQSCEVSVRTTFHWWLQKTPTSIQHRRSVKASGFTNDRLKMTYSPIDSRCVGDHPWWALSKLPSTQDPFHLRQQQCFGVH